MAMFWAWSAMWPFWMPVVASALRAEKFWARPTAAMIRARRSAVVAPRIFRQAWAVGWSFVAPPTRPTASGSSIEALRSPDPVTS